jgi:Family of unknown function (DUF7019)
VHTYWYGSWDKLEALGATDAGLLGRLQTKLKMGLGGAGVEVGLGPRAAKGLDKAVKSAENELDRRGEISDLSSGPPETVYFRCVGPACRSVIAGMSWVAAVDADAAVLLVGSADNAIAAPRNKPEDVFSPSADPIGAVRRLLANTPDSDKIPAPGGSSQANDDRAEEHGGVLSYAWEALMARHLDLVDGEIDGLPRMRAVAQYVAHRRYQPRGEGWQHDVRWLILGTPLYVTQVGKTG